MRTQSDGLGDIVSDQCRLWPDPSETGARQEFKMDADVNVLLRRFGAVPSTAGLRYGETDDSVDLLTALEAQSRAVAVFDGLPASLRALYGSWQELAADLSAGRVRVAPAASSTVPVEGAAGAPSEGSAPAKPV